MGFEVLSGNYPAPEAERRMRALEGRLYSFNEQELRERLKKEGKNNVEIDVAVVTEREKIRKANEKVKAEVMEEEAEKGVAMLEKEMEEKFRGEDKEQEENAA